MTSYPRSGNTLLRAYLERIMGLVTGSDVDIKRKLNSTLLELGLAGEGLADERVWVVKTHYPERLQKITYGAERAILLVRSPLDCIPSFFNMLCSGSHNLSIADDDFQKFSKEWADFIEEEITVWRDFIQFWIDSGIPTHIIRYEDILTRPSQTLHNLMQFVFNQTDIDQTVLSHFIQIIVAQQKVPEVYKPRKGKIDDNRAKYSK